MADQSINLIKVLSSLQGISGGALGDIINIIGDLGAIAASPQGEKLLADIATFVSDIKSKNLTSEEPPLG